MCVRLRLLFLAPLLCVLCLATAHAAAVAAPSAATGFDLLEFEIDGNSVLPDLVVERAVYPHLGPGRGFDDVEAARAALEKAYQDSGYLSVSVVIPQQKVADGVVRLQVMEGAVERLKVSGNQYHARAEIRAEVPELAPGSVPYFPSMQAQLGELNRTPDRRVTPLLRPGRTPGKLEVELAVEDKLPLHGSLELNNRQSPNTSSQRLEAGLRYDNLFQRQHGFGLNYVTSPENTTEVRMLSASYSLPLGRGRSLSFTGLVSDSNIAAAADSAVIGKGSTYGLRLALPLHGLAQTPTFFHNLAIGFDAKDFKETQNLFGADTKVSPLRYTPFTAQYTAGSFSEIGELLGNVSLTAGLRGGSQRLVDCQGEVMDQFACRRAGAQANFSYLRGDLSYTHRILGWEIFARGDFQAARAPLVSNEQFLAGGADSVRGYLEGEVAGDMGWRLRTELKTPSLVDPEPVSIRLAVFLDAAALRLQDPLAGQIGSFSLAGGGLGLRVKAAKYYQLSVDWARAFRAGAQGQTLEGGNRVHARLNASF
jgi:hemolysin activation/secretion protein